MNNTKPNSSKKIYDIVNQEKNTNVLFQIIIVTFVMAIVMVILYAIGYYVPEKDTRESYYIPLGIIINWWIVFLFVIASVIAIYLQHTQRKISYEEQREYALKKIESLKKELGELEEALSILDKEEIKKRTAALAEITNKVQKQKQSA